MSDFRELEGTGERVYTIVSVTYDAPTATDAFYAFFLDTAEGVRIAVSDCDGEPRVEIGDAGRVYGGERAAKVLTFARGMYEKLSTKT